MPAPPPTTSPGSAAPPPAAPGSAAPPPGARLAAFAAILVAGICGGLIGYAVIDKGCEGGCQTTAGGVGLLTAVGAAVGVAVVAVLALRAMGEWQATPEEARRAGRNRRRS